MLLVAKSEREWNERAMQAKASGTDVPFVLPPPDQEEIEASKEQDAEVERRARAAMARKSEEMRASNGNR